MSDYAYPPATGSADGGYFAAPRPAAPAFPPAQSYGPPPVQAGGSGVGVGAAASGTLDDVPAWIVVVATVLALTGLAAGWVGLTMVVTLNAVGATMDGEGILLRALLLLGNAGLNAWLGYQLLRGWEPARVVVSAVCAWWVVYWLYKSSQMGDLTGAASASAFLGGIGQIGTMITLGLLLLSALAAGTAGLLWTPSAGRHLSGR
jgi:hypothetical protein